MSWLVAVLIALLRALLPALVEQMQATAEDADPDRRTRDRLRAKVRRHWGLS